MADKIAACTNVIQEWLERSDSPWRELRVPDEHERLLAKFNPNTLELELPHRGERYRFDLGEIVVEYMKRDVA